MALLRVSDEFKARVISALLMSGVAVVSLWISVWTFAALTVILAAAMCWEWGRAVRSIPFDAVHVAHIVTISIVAIASVFHNPALAGYVLLTGIPVIAALSCKQHRLLSAIGVLYIAAPVFALIWLRNDEPYGIYAVFFVFFVVASHDTSAMLAGKIIGGPRLWPVLSPHKTWSGVIGGLAASCFAGAFFAIVFGYNSIAWLSSLGFVLGVAGLAGDLLESAFKRYYGLRHASMLIPGHGGVLDRFDGVIVAASVAVMIGLAIDQGAPAKALILGR